VNGTTTFIDNVDEETGTPLLSPADIEAIARAELKRIRKRAARAKHYAAQIITNQA